MTHVYQRNKAKYALRLSGGEGGRIDIEWAESEPVHAPPVAASPDRTGSSNIFILKLLLFSLLPAVITITHPLLHTWIAELQLIAPDTSDRGTTQEGGQEGSSLVETVRFQT